MMQLLTESITHLPEILSAVVIVLGGQKGLEVYHRKKHANGNGKERRSNSFAETDKSFIREIIADQTTKLGLVMKTDRLELVMKLKDVIQDDGEKTREAVRAQ